MSFLTEIADKLASLGLGVVNTTIHLGKMPESPDVCCAVYETGGMSPDFGFGSAAIKYESPAVQVVFRGAKYDYLGPYNSCYTAYTGLAQVQAQLLGATFYHWIHPKQAPFKLREDPTSRMYIACNFQTEKDP